MAREMYGTRPLLSASRLELFNKCPFAHYMRYGLLAKERRESGEQAADAGTFFHEALQRFLQRCREKGLALHTLGEEEAMAVVSEILPELIAMHNDGIFLRDDRLRAGLFLRIDMLKRCVLSLLRQVQAGTFTPLSFQHGIGSASRLFYRTAQKPFQFFPAAQGPVVACPGNPDRICRRRSRKDRRAYRAGSQAGGAGSFHGPDAYPYLYPGCCRRNEGSY